jgi:hypothetical protein
MSAEDGNSDLVRKLISDQVHSLRQFIERLQTYDGKSGCEFRLIIVECISRFELPARRLAGVCRTSHTTVTRWAKKETLPTELARMQAVTQIGNELRARLDEMSEKLPPAYMVAERDTDNVSVESV